MRLSVDPAKAAQREELSQQMAEFEERFGPIKTLPIVARYEDPASKILSDMQRRRGQKGLAARHAK